MGTTSNEKVAVDQIEVNRAAYNKIRKDMESEHNGKYALMNNGKVAGIYNDSGDAYSIGCDKFGLGDFTIEKVGEAPISLGILTLCCQIECRAELSYANFCWANRKRSNYFSIRSLNPRKYHDSN